jgi:simple sugar transport system ATP-binding protein
LWRASFRAPIKLLIASQPTRGLDVGSIEYIHGPDLSLAAIRRDEGVAVLWFPPNWDEVLQLSDRIAVMYRGKTFGLWFRRPRRPKKVSVC